MPDKPAQEFLFYDFVSFMHMKKFVAGLFVFSVLVGALVFVTSWLLKRSTIKTYNHYVAVAPYDVIIVPGLPYDTLQQNMLLKVRILWAKNLYDKGITGNIIFSGSAVHTPWVEGRIMKTIADSLGIPASHTFVEDKAEHGNENVYYSWKLAKQMGFKKIALATDQYQNSFLSSFIKKKTPDVALLPVSVDSFSVYGKQDLPVIDASGALVDDFVPLKDRESRWERFQSSFSNEVEDKNQ